MQCRWPSELIAAESAVKQVNAIGKDMHLARIGPQGQRRMPQVFVDARQFGHHLRVIALLFPYR